MTHHRANASFCITLHYRIYRYSALAVQPALHNQKQSQKNNEYQVYTRFFSIGWGDAEVVQFTRMFQIQTGTIEKIRSPTVYIQKVQGIVFANIQVECRYVKNGFYQQI
jgi:hypothetical protein